MVGDEFDRGGSCDDSFAGFDVVVWCDQVYSGKGCGVVHLYVSFPPWSTRRLSCGDPLCDVLDRKEVTVNSLLLLGDWVCAEEDRTVCYFVE
jgi:hypothetical protein